MTRLPSRSLAALGALVFLAGCGGPGQDNIEEPIDTPDPDAVVSDFITEGDRPAAVHVPESYDPRTPMPLLVFLHGYGFSGATYEEAMKLTAQADMHGFLYTYPDGLSDQDGKPFWNASRACCNFYGSEVDDAAYLLGLINEIKETVNVDDKRVFLMGHSNGAFMAHRLACEHADVISGLVSISGVTTTSCTPSEPVSLLHVHGTADTTIAYNGGSLGAPYLSATDSTELWAALNGCNLPPRQLPDPIDVDLVVPGAETTVTVYDDGCGAGGYAELWRVEGGGHAIQGTAEFTNRVVDFLLSHPKP